MKIEIGKKKWKEKKWIGVEKGTKRKEKRVMRRKMEEKGGKRRQEDRGGSKKREVGKKSERKKGSERNEKIKTWREVEREENEKGLRKRGSR